MIKYVCHCGAAHTAEEWDSVTEFHFGDNCASVKDEQRQDYLYVCPKCGEEWFGDKITVQESE